MTGEDKSTWFWLLRRGRAMLYLPDVRVVTIEHPPARWLLPAATQLMLRWFGNMLRTSSRAIALGPRRIGAFTWWCLIDQRISMWTPLIGPIVAVIFVLGKSAVFLYTYLLWVGMTRLVQALLLLTARPRISGLYPPLIYFGQVYGALVKTYVMFRLDRQRWTRQNIALDLAAGTGRARLRRSGSAYLHLLALRRPGRGGGARDQLSEPAAARHRAARCSEAPDAAADRPRSPRSIASTSGSRSRSRSRSTASAIRSTTGRSAASASRA